MGTRGAYGFIKNGVEKVTYNHFDSYPNGLGDAILNALAGMSIEQLNEAFERIELVSGEDDATEQQIAACEHLADQGVNTGQLNDWYVLLRKAQGHIEAYWEEQPLCYMVDSKNFLKDSLFCEFAYIVNLDTNVLEFYKGFNCSPGGKGRYAQLMREKDIGKGGLDVYFGVNLLLEIPLQDITKDTVTSLTKKMQDTAHPPEDEDKVDEILEPSNPQAVSKNDIDVYFAIRDKLTKLEIDLPNNYIKSMQELAEKWSELAGREIDIGDAISILLAKLDKQDFDKIIKKHK